MILQETLGFIELLAPGVISAAQEDGDGDGDGSVELGLGCSAEGDRSGVAPTQSSACHVSTVRRCET